MRIPTSYQMERGNCQKPSIKLNEVRVAHGWDQPLGANADLHIPTLTAVNKLDIFPQSKRTAVEI
jgi:hypothetical protein